ncbi:asparagine synthase-related protein [Pseudonocardia alni]|uniref:asparagine synthase-related protein n=1 Tax=Pseudonocardia alni TaxID=33907 RepID=UPI0027DE30D9|nr:asparagine synthase-related protein [Pseudonocardia alni]
MEPMCGIVAAFGGPTAWPGGEPADPGKYERMLARVAHRGPDDTGVQVVGNTWLGHQRLSIMDVSGGHQPMSDVARTAWIVGNGEIYNHERIAKAFPDGTVRTKSDTEAALHAVMWDGQAAVASLNGMFAVAMGRTDGAGLVARDPFGVKPLYWVPPAEFRDGGGAAGAVPYTAPDPSETVLFASELRAFDPEDRPYVRSFPPGCLWSPSSGLVRFADAVPVEVRPARRAIRPGWDDADLSRVREAVVSAVRRRMMSDVGVGVFLSGGLDSALVAAIAAQEARARGEQLPTFAVGTAESGDLIAARKVAAHIGSDHHEILVTPEDIAEALDHAVEVIEHYDPALVRSAVPNLILAREAARKVKVVLTGEGADELFAGYSYIHGPEYADPDTLQAELVRSLEQLHHLNLQRCDRTTMYFGLEAREPFLDSGLVRAALALPPEWKQCPDGRPEKAILREAFEGWLPEDLLWRGKEQFGDGSGAGTVLAELAARKAAAAADAGETDGVPEHPSDSWPLRSEEEVLYHGIWRSHFDGIRPDHVLGAFATA